VFSSWAALDAAGDVCRALPSIRRTHQLFGQETVVSLDPEQTKIDFTLSATLHAVHGTFKLKSGVLRFENATGKASGLIVVDAISGESGNKGRDRKMHKDILESWQYPEVVFTPLCVHGPLATNQESRVQIGGLMKLHGTEHETTMEARVTVTGDHLDAETHFAIPYVAWGLKNPSAFLLRVGNVVHIDVRTTGRITRRGL
jgi:polyisoprenoid-binding protein YceI